MTQLLLQDSSPWLVENWLPYDWPVHVAFLLALLTLTGIVVTTVIATSWQDFRMQRNGRPGAEPY